jgi:hypothetical protein
MKEDQLAIIDEALKKAGRLRGPDDQVFVNYVYFYLEDAKAKLIASFEQQEKDYPGGRAPEPKSMWDGFPDNGNGRSAAMAEVIAKAEPR